MPGITLYDTTTGEPAQFSPDGAIYAIRSGTYSVPRDADFPVLDPDTHRIVIVKGAHVHEAIGADMRPVTQEEVAAARHEQEMADLRSAYGPVLLVALAGILVCGIVYGLIRAGRAVQSAGTAIQLRAHQWRDARAQTESFVERRLAALMIEFPSFDDRAICDLVHGEMRNAGMMDGAAYSHANEATAARIRTMLAATIIRAMRRNAP
jgi:hypothetical protein